jgi:spore maturation protein CgeB
MASFAFDPQDMSADDEGESILIAGPPFRGYLDMIASGFESCGLRPTTLSWEYPRRNIAQEVMYYSSEGYRRMRGDAQDVVNSKVLEKAIIERGPDHVLVAKAVELTERSKAFCRDRGIKLILWAYDSATEFPIVSRAAPGYDLVYTYEPADLEILSSVCEPRLLPMAFDPRYYSPLKGEAERTIDICFVGDIDFYRRRRELLRHVARNLRNANVSVWTDSAHWYSHRRVKDMALKGLRRNLSIRRGTLGHAEINGIYNRSKACLNIHHRQSRQAINPRTFEVLGSGGLLVTDRKLDQLSEFQDGKGYIHFEDEKGLIDSLREALGYAEYRESIASLGNSRIQAHTYVARARRIIEDAKRLG